MNKNLQIVLDVVRMSISADPNDMNLAGQKLPQLEAQNGYALYLMQIIQKPDCNPTLRQQACSFLMNFLRRQYQPNVRDCVIPEDQKILIKQKIIPLLINSPPGPIQNLLIECIRIISVHDFPSQWLELLPSLLKQFENPNINIHSLYGVVFCVHSIFERYRGVILDQDLANELNKIIDLTGPYLRKLFGILLQNFKNKINDSTNGLTHLKIVLMSLEIFFDLTHVDIQEFFEEKKTLTFFMKGFDFLLTHPPSKLLSINEVFYKLRTQICNILQLFMEKYDENFSPYCEQFVQSVCRLLGNLHKQSQLMNETYNPLITSALKFLTTVSTGIRRDVFTKNPGVVENICKQIVIPNVFLRESNVNIFETDPISYIHRDIEGSDSYTRRRASVDLLNGLKEYNYKIVSEIVLSEIKKLLNNYYSAVNSSNEKDNFFKKDAAIYLMIAISIKSKTRRHGVIDLNPNINIIQFFANHILSELKKSSLSNSNIHPILICDCLKFITLFRLHVATINNFENLMNCLLKWLKSKNPVIATYSSWAVERILSIYNPENEKIRFTSINLNLAAELFKNLFECNKIIESNEYVIRGIYRIIELLKLDIFKQNSLIKNLVTSISLNLKKVCANPTNPKYNHFLFECIHSLIYFASQNNQNNSNNNNNNNNNTNQNSILSNLENEYCPIFLNILEKKVEDFSPYVFQIFSQFLENKISNQSREYYSKNFSMWMKPEYWENMGNIPGLVGLIGSYCKVYPNIVLENNNLMLVLSKFRNLMKSRRLCHEGFYILNHLIFYIPKNKIEEHFKKIFTLLLNRLNTLKNDEKYLRCCFIFFSCFILKYSTSLFVSIIESIQNGLFQKVLKTWLKHVHFVQGSSQRKICSTALAKLFYELSLLKDSNFDMLKNLLFNAIKFLEVEKKEVTFFTEKEMDEFKEQVNLSKAEYTGKFVKLKYMDKISDASNELNFTKNIKDSKCFFAGRIDELLKHNNVNISKRTISIIKQSDKKVYTSIQNYFRKARINFTI